MDKYQSNERNELEYLRNLKIYFFLLEINILPITKSP